MIRSLRLAIAALALALSPASADTYSPAMSGDFLGTFAYSALPPASPANFGARASVSDLGGDPGGEVRSTGTCWKRTSNLVAPASILGAAVINIVALLSPSSIQITSPGSVLPSVTLQISGACPGDTFHVIIPSGLMTAASTVGVQINSAPLLSGTGTVSGTWGDYTFTGSAVIKTAGGPL